MERRGVLRFVAFLFGALCGGTGLATLFDPARRRSSDWQAVAALSEVPPGGKRVSLKVKAGWETADRPVILLRAGDEVVAFDARCTHLGCTVRFREGAFRCPCHAGVFDRAGAPVSGPVREPLRTLPARVVDGQVQIRA